MPHTSASQNERTNQTAPHPTVPAPLSSPHSRSSSDYPTSTQSSSSLTSSCACTAHAYMYSYPPFVYGNIPWVERCIPHAHTCIYLQRTRFRLKPPVLVRCSMHLPFHPSCSPYVLTTCLPSAPLHTPSSSSVTVQSTPPPVRVEFIDKNYSIMGDLYLQILKYLRGVFQRR
ncbi:hypothetical protein BC629DRAFT_918284 [Irpex lacteus]|nr:hypothetical protein BC629DRAFT_918284 [Irpex lacteus]